MLPSGVGVSSQLVEVFVVVFKIWRGSLSSELFSDVVKADEIRCDG